MHYDKDLVQGWISLQRTDENSPEYEKLFVHWEAVTELVRERPAAAWLFVLEVLKADSSTAVLEDRSARPLEDLLAQHGGCMIDRVEEEARANPKVASVLGGVWKNAMTDEVWQRVQKIRDRRGWGRLGSRAWRQQGVRPRARAGSYAGS